MNAEIRKMEKTFKIFQVKGIILPVFLSLFFLNISAAQSLQEEDKKVIRETNKLLRNAEEDLAENDFPSAEANYRKAVSKQPGNVTSRYNMANMYYGKEKPAQAATRLKQAAKIAETKEDKHKIFHNLGNSFMKQKKYQEAVNAYKDALRNNPKDEETRYNYALAKKMLEEEQKDGGGGEDENEDQQDQDQQDQDKEQGDEGDQEQQENQSGEDQEDSEGDPQDESGEPEDEGGEEENKQEQGEGEPEQQQSQPQPGQLSPEQIKSLLEAMNNEEKKVQDKINAEKAKGSRTRNEKDW